MHRRTSPTQPIALALLALATAAAATLLPHGARAATPTPAAQPSPTSGIGTALGASQPPGATPASSPGGGVLGLHTSTPSNRTGVPATGTGGESPWVGVTLVALGAAGSGLALRRRGAERDDRQGGQPPS